MDKPKQARVLAEGVHKGKIGNIRHVLQATKDAPITGYVLEFVGDQRVWPEPYHDAVPYRPHEIEIIS